MKYYTDKLWCINCKKIRDKDDFEKCTLCNNMIESYTVKGAYYCRACDDDYIIKNKLYCPECSEDKEALNKLLDNENKLKQQKKQEVLDRKNARNELFLFGIQKEQEEKILLQKLIELDKKKIIQYRCNTCNKNIHINGEDANDYKKIREHLNSWDHVHREYNQILTYIHIHKDGDEDEDEDENEDEDEENEEKK